MLGDPKPARRVVNLDALPLDMGPYARSTCPLCGRHGVSLSRHHVLPKRRGGGGDDVPVNLVFCCGDGARGCHGVLTHRGRDGETGLTFEEVGARLVAYVRTLPAVVAYVEAAKWPGWLESYYGDEEQVAA